MQPLHTCSNKSRCECVCEGVSVRVCGGECECGVCVCACVALGVSVCVYICNVSLGTRGFWHYLLGPSVAQWSTMSEENIQTTVESQFSQNRK